MMQEKELRDKKIEDKIKQVCKEIEKSVLPKPRKRKLDTSLSFDYGEQEESEEEGIASDEDPVAEKKELLKGQ